jgi:hypothetical protein
MTLTSCRLDPARVLVAVLTRMPAAGIRLGDIPATPGTPTAPPPPGPFRCAPPAPSSSRTCTHQRRTDLLHHQGPRHHHHHHRPRLVPPQGRNPARAVAGLPPRRPQPWDPQRLGHPPRRQQQARRRRAPAENPQAPPQDPRQPRRRPAITSQERPAPRPAGRLLLTRHSHHAGPVRPDPGHQGRPGPTPRHTQDHPRPGSPRTQAAENVRPKREHGPWRNVKTSWWGAWGSNPEPTD